MSFDERIPVIFLDRKDDADAPPLDPKLVEFLRACEEHGSQEGLVPGLETSRKRRVGVAKDAVRAGYVGRGG